MYKYYQDLDKKEGITTSIKSHDFCTEKPLQNVNFYNLPEKLITILQEILRELPVLDLYISRLDALILIDESDIFIHCQFQDYFENNAVSYNDIWQRINLSFLDVLEILNVYKVYIKYLLYFFPHITDYLTSVLNKINIATKMLEKVTILSIVPSKTKEIKWPNNWFITPNGYLYNAGKSGDKSRGLYIDIAEIYNALQKGDKVEDFLDKRIEQIQAQIEKISVNGYITLDDYYPYSNLWEFPSSELIVLASQSNSNEICRFETLPDSEPSKCYLLDFRNLIIGYLNARLCLYDYYLKRIKNGEIIVPSLSENLIALGFSQVLPDSKTILTSSSQGYDDLELYRQNGWEVKIISEDMPSIRAIKKEN